jgi:hypothetical protein
MTTRFRSAVPALALVAAPGLARRPVGVSLDHLVARRVRA